MLPRTVDGDKELKICQYLKQQERHPNITTVIGNLKVPHHRASEGYKEEFTVLVLPITGMSLTDRQQKSGIYKTTEKERKQWIRDAVQGMSYLHKLGIVHGG
jgi:serine/threonine protein kinase